MKALTTLELAAQDHEGVEVLCSFDITVWEALPPPAEFQMPMLLKQRRRTGHAVENRARLMHAPFDVLHALHREHRDAFNLMCRGSTDADSAATLTACWSKVPRHGTRKSFFRLFFTSQLSPTTRKPLSAVPVHSPAAFEPAFMPACLPAPIHSS